VWKTPKSVNSDQQKVQIFENNYSSLATEDSLNSKIALHDMSQHV